MITLEQRLKRALPIGAHLVNLIHVSGASRKARVVIPRRGPVRLLPMPVGDDMYTSEAAVVGDSLKWGKGAVVVWAARSAEFMAQFESPASYEVAV